MLSPELGRPMPTHRNKKEWLFKSLDYIQALTTHVQQYIKLDGIAAIVHLEEMEQTQFM